MNDKLTKDFLDGQRSILIIPESQRLRQEELNGVIKAFEHGRFYNEQEVMLLLADSCINEDYSLLCKELLDNGMLSTNKELGTFWRSDFMCGNLKCEELQLRDMCNNDLSTLMSIHNSLKYYEDITGEAYTIEEAQALIDKTDLPPDGSKEFYIGKMILSPNGQVAGYLMLYEGYPSNDTLWLGSLFIHQDYHRKGFGGMIMRTLTEIARESGYRSIGIGVYALNTSGLQFWVGQGFGTLDRVNVNEHQRAILALSKQLL